MRSTRFVWHEWPQFFVGGMRVLRVLGVPFTRPEEWRERRDRFVDGLPHPQQERIDRLDSGDCRLIQRSGWSRTERYAATRRSARGFPKRTLFSIATCSERS